MDQIFSFDNISTLLMLVLLQAVLGFDNLLYISIESKRVPADSQASVRRIGIGLAILLRIVLLFVIIQAIQYFQAPFVSFHQEGIVEGSFNVHAALTLLGGAFIIYTAMKEIAHMLAIDELGGYPGHGGTRSVASAVTWIVLMNLVFSFDSILSAMALTDVFWVMATAIVISGLLMIWLSDHVAEFLEKNRMYEVLGLFVLFIVGILLVSEGGHLAHLKLLGYAVEPMAKSTFYFVLAVLLVVDIVQSRYQKKLLAQKALEREAATHITTA
ncbi:MAG: tellurium resistance protein TerC [Alphaproteobacteria bacterium]|nr:tellurium resistance protein TerC [Alphaproteobacteria bacterium]